MLQVSKVLVSNRLSKTVDKGKVWSRLGLTGLWLVHIECNIKSNLQIATVSKSLPILTLITMKSYNVNVWLTILLEVSNDIKVRFGPSDNKNLLSYETIVQIFDKRLIIRGAKDLKEEFKQKRRECLLKNMGEITYKKIVMHYNKLLETKLEANLNVIAKKVKY